MVDIHVLQAVEVLDQPRHAGHGELGLQLLDRGLRLLAHPPRRRLAGQLGLRQGHGQFARRLVDGPPHDLVGRQQPLAGCVQPLELLTGRPAATRQVAEHALPNGLGLHHELPALLAGRVAQPPGV